MGLCIAIAVIVVLALLGLLVTVRRRDAEAATGDLSRETRKRDRSTELPPEIVGGGEDKPLTGREVERAAALERREPSREVVPADSASKVPAVAGPVDLE